MTVYVYDPIQNKVVPREDRIQVERSRGTMIMSDIAPYKSTITGEMISSRSFHRDHLKRHDCFEIGNEKQPLPKPLAPPPGLRETIARTVYQMT